MLSVHSEQISDQAVRRSRGNVGAKLERKLFEMPRELEYLSEKELRAQIGHAPDFWPAAILRELVDNALDAAELAGVLPVIEITTADDCITVTDNGTGIPETTIRRSLDFMVRVSNKAYYVSPTRGQMGNALKVIYAAPFVSTGNGSVEISSHGTRHRIEITVDRIAQRPRITHETEPSDVKTGTIVKVAWADSTTSICEPGANSYNSPPTARELIAGFAAFNPHTTFILDGETIERSVTTWPKWSPDQPTSAHWYDSETLRDLIGAHIAQERDGGRTVREFVSEFRGLSGTAKQKLVTKGWSGKRLHDFIIDGDFDAEFVPELLQRMQAHSKAPAPRLLGLIGQEYLSAWMTSQGVVEQSIRYVKKLGIDRLPYVLEMAFGVRNDDSGRHIVTGLNWSPTIGGAPDPTLRSAVAHARLDPGDPATFVVHIARPRFQFADRGKTKVALCGDIQDAIAAATKSVTKSWKQAKRKADREDRVSQRAIERMCSYSRVTIREVAFRVMPDAYNKASSNGKYFANARQIMYAARPAILAEIDEAQFNDVYFTQTLLKDYMEEHSPDWNVVWDARGNLVEPHTGHKIPLGGRAVGQYCDEWHGDVEQEAPAMKARISTQGPQNRFSSVLFIEKEGFAEILFHAGIGARYDAAVMSTKGIPVKAACDLVRQMHSQDVQIFVLRDFDLAGFKIVRTLRTGTRLSSGSPVIDLGLRLEDIQDLQAEPVAYSQHKNPAHYLRDCGASPEEIDMLVQSRFGVWHGQRVEINAMDSEQLIEWLEAKFDEHGVKKLIPDMETLEQAYRRAVFLREIQTEIEHLEEELQERTLKLPSKLSARVKAMLKEHPRLSWDDAIWKLAEAGVE